MRLYQHLAFICCTNLLLLACFGLEARQLRLTEADSSYIIGKQTQIFFAPKGKRYSIDQVAQSGFAARFEPSEQEFPSFGYKDSEIWVKVKVSNPSSRSDWMLHLGAAYIDTLDFFAPTPDGGWRKVETGRKRPFNNRGEIKAGTFYFPLHLATNEEATFYLRASSKLSIALPMTILPKAVAHDNTQDWHIWYGLYSGTLLIMIFYNLFVFVALRNLNYLFYVFTIISTLLTFVSVGGYAYKYLHPNHPEVSGWLLQTAMSMIVVTTSVFAIQFLNIRKYSNVLFYALVATASAALLLLLLHASFPNPYLLNLTIRIQAPLLLVSGIWAWRKGSKFARFFVLAWVFYVIGGVMITMRNAGTLPFNFWTSHSAEIGSALEVALISLALADQYRVIRKEKEAATKQLLAVEQEAKTNLESKVEERTLQLKESNEELQQLNEEMQMTLETVQQQNEEIAEKNREITSSINYAQRIQQAILPPQEVIRQQLPEHFILFKPCQVVSGDFYFFLEEDGLLFLAAVDCTGHGVPGALMSMIGYNLLREIILVRKVREPQHILSLLHQEVANALRQQSTGNRDGMDLSLCVIDRRKGELRFSGAKNHLVCVGAGEVQLFKGSRNSIGGQYFQEDFPFEQHCLPLDAQTTFYLHSDGYPDQFGGAENRKFRQGPFRKLLAQIAEKPLIEQQQLLEQRLSDWMGESHQKQIDDILIIGFRVAPDAPSE